VEARSCWRVAGGGGDGRVRSQRRSRTTRRPVQGGLRRGGATYNDALASGIATSDDWYDRTSAIASLASLGCKAWGGAGHAFATAEPDQFVPAGRLSKARAPGPTAPGAPVSPLLGTAAAGRMRSGRTCDWKGRVSIIAPGKGNPPQMRVRQRGRIRTCDTRDPPRARRAHRTMNRHGFMVVTSQTHVSGSRGHEMESHRLEFRPPPAAGVENATR
jgi:hypothetical protein